MNMKKGYKSKNFEKREDIAGEYRWGDAGQLFLALVFIAGMLIDLFLLKIQFPFHEVIPFYIRVLVVASLFVISGYLAKSGLKIVFGEKRERLMVIRSGVFSFVRHPIYLGSILLFLGFTILSLSIVAGILWIIIVIFYFFLSWYEERLLINKIGKEYEQYMKEVPMFIPRILGRKK